MGVSARSTLIADAITQAGRKSEGFDLTRKFDSVLQYMTRQYPLLKTHVSGSTVASQNYIPLPDDYGCRRFLIVNSNPLVWAEPDSILAYINSNTLTDGTPYNWTIVEEESKIYMVSPPDDAYTYYFAYGRLHPRAGKSVAFTSGGTHELLIGDTITGATSGATGEVSDIILTSGTWAAGTAAGTLIVIDDTGTFQAENIDEGSNTNVATIAGALGDADDYEHLLGYEFEEALLMFLTGECCKLQQEVLLAEAWRKQGEFTLRRLHGKKNKTYNAPHSTFWNPSWRMRSGT